MKFTQLHCQWNEKLKITEFQKLTQQKANWQKDLIKDNPKGMTLWKA